MNYKNIISEFSCLFTCAVFFLLVSPLHAQADFISLKVSPSVLRIEAKPPADIWTPFTIENLSNQPVSLRIGYKAFNPQLSSNGTVVFLTNGQQLPGVDKNIFDKMQIVDDNNVSHDIVVLGPRQQERFRLRILLPQNEPTSDYYFSLIFLQTTNQIGQNTSESNIGEQRSYSTIQGGIGLNVLLAVGDIETPSGIIQTFNTPLFSNGGPIPFTLKISDSGDHFIEPNGFITIKNTFGQTVGKINIPSSVILEGTTRTFGSTPISTNNNLETEQVLLWPQNFSLGMNTATLTLNMSTGGPVYIRTIPFISFPVISFIEFVIILIIVLYIYLRVKRKLS